MLDNRVVHNGTFAGIDAFSSSGNIFANNEVVDNNIVQRDSVHLGPTIQQDIGIWVVNLNPSNPGGASNNTVSDNQVVNNGLDGIQIARFADMNRVTGNTVVDNGFGQPKGKFRDGDGIADFGSNNLVHKNLSFFNGANGIRVVVGGLNNTITGNEAFGNGTGVNSAGIAFDLSDTNLSPPCDANTWSDNLFGTINQPCVASHR